MLIWPNIITQLFTPVGLKGRRTSRDTNGAYTWPSGRRFKFSARELLCLLIITEGTDRQTDTSDAVVASINFPISSFFSGEFDFLVEYFNCFSSTLDSSLAVECNISLKLAKIIVFFWFLICKEFAVSTTPK
jgi:hypothetical protein